MKVFIIKFTAYGKDNLILKEGKFKVKNSPNKFVAQAKFENFLIRKYSSFERLVVHECKEDIMSAFSDMFGGGANPFGGGKNPFGSF